VHSSWAREAVVAAASVRMSGGRTSGGGNGRAMWRRRDLRAGCHCARLLGESIATRIGDGIGEFATIAIQPAPIPQFSRSEFATIAIQPAPIL